MMHSHVPPALSLILLFPLLLPLASSSSQIPISLSLRQLQPPPKPDPFQRLAGLASASLLRARHLKSPKTAPPLAKTALFPHSYGGYSISLNFGTPPQQIPLILDTGSDLVWVPCTKSYLCRNCSFPSPNPKTSSGFPIFFPKSSASSRLIGCKNPKCGWIHSSGSLSTCRSCVSNSTDCSQICPPYVVLYGSGSTAGLLLSEALDFPGRTVPNFVVGCSVFSNHQPAAGIAGFGWGLASLPSQLGLKRFSYCLISRRYDDEVAESGSAVLGGPPDSRYDGVSFTPLLKNPAAAPGSAFSIYYYVGLRRIIVGGMKVRIPHGALMPGPTGDGGTIVDSGTTFSYMESGIFELVARAIENQVAGRYNRSADVEDLTGLRPCFSMPAEVNDLKLPELAFHFKGGAEMRLPLENYFAVLGNSGSVCLTVVSDTGHSGGPSIIIGNFQQQNYHMMYDLERQRLGFRRQSCAQK